MSFTSSRRTYDTDLITLRRIFAYDLSNSPFSTGFLLTSITKGVATFASPNFALSTIGVSNLPAQLSSLEGALLSTFGAFTSNLPSSPGVFLPSTVGGLGASGYISTASLTSTIIGLGTLGYLSSSVIEGALQSSIIGLGSAGYVSTASLTTSLTSTVQGLGSSGYISSLGFVLPSTVQGLGTAGYISTASLTSSLNAFANFGFISSMVSSVRSTFTNVYPGNWCNAGFLYSNLAPFATVQTFQFDIGDGMRTQMNVSTTNLDLECKANLQFGYYDPRSIQYDFSTCLVKGVSLNTSTIIAQENLSYYILNASEVNLPFFFTEKYRFLLNSASVISSLKNDSQFSTLSVFHRIGISSPTTNQLFVIPAKPTSITVVLDNTTHTQ